MKHIWIQVCSYGLREISGPTLPLFSQGAYVQQWAPVGNLWRKQTTMLVVFKGPQITRKVMLPSLQHAQSRFKEYFSKLHQKLSMTTRLKFKVINFFVVCKSHTTKLAANASRYIMSLRTWQAVSRDILTWKRGSSIIPLCVWRTPSWVFVMFDIFLNYLRFIT